MIDIETSTFKISHQPETIVLKPTLRSWFLDRQLLWLKHPYKEGCKYRIVRNRFQRWFRPKDYATHREIDKFYRRYYYETTGRRL